MKRRKNLITFLTFVLIIFTTFTYSALSTRFQVITDVVFRVDAECEWFEFQQCVQCRYFR